MKFSYTTRIKHISLLALLILFSLPSYSQYDLASPYSVFGPGIPHLNQTVSQAGMGGAGVALINPYKMDYSNPASLAYHLAPIFEMSGKATYSTFSTNAGNFENKSFMLNNISLSFPIRHGIWGLAIGLKPYTTVGYDVQTTLANTDLDIAPQTNYSGSGGISQAYVGMAHTLFTKRDSAKNFTSLAFGANFNYNVGTVTNNRQLVFPGDEQSQALRITESTLFRDASFDFGLHYQTNIIKRTRESSRYLRLLLGGVYTLGTDLNSRRSTYVYNFSQVSLVPGDTLSSLIRQSGTVHVPTRFAMGVGLDFISAQRQRLRFALDYSQQNWSEYTEEFADQISTFQFQDSWRIATGLEYTPELGASNYFRTIEYRVGFDYQQSNLYLSGTNLNDMGISAGLSLPVHHRRKLTKSTFHIAAKYGKYGTLDHNLIKENYFEVYIGFSFTPHFRNRWFVQPKYD